MRYGFHVDIVSMGGGASLVVSRRLRFLFEATFLALFACMAPNAAAQTLPKGVKQPGDAPLPVLRAGDARFAVIRKAESYRGTPYRLGGEDLSGMDCSGLVFRAYYEATGWKLPRTVASLAAWVEPVRSGELEPGDLIFFSIDGVRSGSPLSKADHVAVYAGDGDIVHAVSKGSRTGVVISSISEPYWASRRLGAGRVLPRQGYLGISVDLDLGALASADVGAYGPDGSRLRGGSVGIGLAYPIGSVFMAGMQTRVSYDELMGVARLPLEARLSIGKNLDIFAGPALTFGTPVLPAGAGDNTADRPYAPSGQWAGSAGFRWTPFWSREGAWKLGLGLEFRYDRYLPANSDGMPAASEPVSDRLATMTLGILFRLRTTK